MPKLPEIPVLSVRWRSNKELDAIAEGRIGPVLDEIAEILGTDKEPFVIERKPTKYAKRAGEPPLHTPSGKLQREVSEPQRLPERLSAEVNQMIKKIDRQVEEQSGSPLSVLLCRRRRKKK